MSEEMATRARGDRILMIADGFIFAGALWLLFNVVPGALLLWSGAPEPSAMGGVLGGSLWLLTTIVPILAGAVAAWVLHGRRLSTAGVVGMIVGLAAGFFAGFALLGAVAMGVRWLSESVLSLRGDGPPWALVVILGLALVAIVALPLFEAIRDLGRSRRHHTRIDYVRLASLGVIAVLAVVVAPWVGYVYGSEIAEAGAFLGPIAFAGSAAVAGAEILTSYLDRRRRGAGGGVKAPGVHAGA